MHTVFGHVIQERFALALACLATAAPAPAAAAAEGVLALPYDSQGTVFLLDREPYLEVRFAGWGPGWAWQNFRGEVEDDGEASRAVSRTTIAASGAEVQIVTHTVPTGPRQLAIEFEVTSDRDTDLTLLMAGVQPAASAFRGGKMVVTHADDRTTTMKRLGSGLDLQLIAGACLMLGAWSRGRAVFDVDLQRAHHGS